MKPSPVAGRKISHFPWEAAAAVLLILVFLSQLVAYPRLPDAFLFRAGLGYSQAIAAHLAAALRENSFAELLRSGLLPSHGESYQGLLMAYLYLPFELALGSRWWVYSFWHLLFGVPAVLLTFFMMRVGYGRVPALLTLLFLVCHPGFVSGMRMGGELNAHMTFFSCAAAYLFVLWWTRDRPLLFASAMFVVCLAMSAKLWFHWILAWLLLAGALFAVEIRKRISTDRGRVSAYVIGALFLLAGLFFAQPGRIFERLAMPEYSLSIPDYLSGLPKTFLAVTSVVSSLVFRGNEQYLTYRFWETNDAFSALLWASVLFLLFRHLRPRGQKKYLIFPLAFLMMTAIPPLLGDRVPEPYPFFFYPIPSIVMALALVELSGILTDRRWRAFLPSVLITAVVAGNVHALTQYFRDMRHYGLGSAGAETYEGLVNWLRKNDGSGKTILCRGLPDVQDEIFRWRLSASVPHLRFRFVMPVSGGDPVDVSYAMHENAGHGLTVVMLRDGQDVVRPKALADWLSGGQPREPLARFSSDGGPLFEIYSFALPGESPVRYSIVPSWRKWTVRV